MKNIIKKFVKDIERYSSYLLYSSVSELKSEVVNSYLGWIWWVLDPLLFMFVYMFVSLVVFNKSEQYFPLFVFIGLSTWQFFDKTIKQSVKLVSSNKSIVSKIYIPKFILIITKVFVNGFKMLISYGLIIVMLFLFRVPISFNIFYSIPLIIVMTLFTFGLSCIVLHVGVYIEDLANIINVVLRFIFYLTGIFYSLENRVPYPWNKLLMLNPIAFIIDSLRKCILYSRSINMLFFALWVVISIVISLVGVKLIYKYENSYVKVI